MRKKQVIKNFKDNLKKEEPLIKNVSKLYMNKKELTLFKNNPDDYLKALTEDELVDLIQYLNYPYYIDGDSLVSDELYDLVKEKLKKKNSNHPLLKSVGITSINKANYHIIWGQWIK